MDCLLSGPAQLTSQLFFWPLEGGYDLSAPNRLAAGRAVFYNNTLPSRFGTWHLLLILTILSAQEAISDLTFPSESACMLTVAYNNAQ